MGVLLYKHNNSIFQKLPIIQKAAEEVSRRNAESLLNTLGHIFVKHGMWDKFAIVLVHRHFSLEENEILVECEGKKEVHSVALPWKVDGNRVTPAARETDLLSKYDIDPSGFVVPLSWCFDLETKQLVPFEYTNSKAENFDTPNSAFVKELYDVLHINSVEHLFGVRMYDKNISQSSWEITPAGVRANITTLGDKPNDLDGRVLVRVAWTFDVNESMSLKSSCDFRCGRHCERHN